MMPWTYDVTHWLPFYDENQSCAKKWLQWCNILYMDKVLHFRKSDGMGSFQLIVYSYICNSYKNILNKKNILNSQNVCEFNREFYLLILNFCSLKAS